MRGYDLNLLKKKLRGLLRFNFTPQQFQHDEILKTSLVKI